MSRSPSAPDFGPLAETYDALRPADDNWREVADALVREGDLAGRRVLDVGCGTGRFASLLAAEHGSRVWGVDPSPEMLDVARRRAPRGVGLKLAGAEDLPFTDGWFERATMWLVAHLVDRGRAFAEARRVLGPDGRFVVATFDPVYFDDFWLNRLFPSLESLDRKRFPERDELEAELREATFGAVRIESLRQRGRVARDEALEKIRGRFISTLRLLEDDEYASGLERAERELPDVTEYRVDWLVTVAATGTR
jgi:ubiquinone/menaquinone biosynthesis C-methylase UbiE